MFQYEREDVAELGVSSKEGNVRFKTKNVGNTMSLVSRLVRNLTDRVDKVHSNHPLVVRELDFASKVVNVSDQTGEDLSGSGLHVGAHGLDDPAGEGGIEAAKAVAACVFVCGHCESRL